MNVGLLVTLLIGGLGLGGTLGYFFGADKGRKDAISKLQVSSEYEGGQQLLLVNDKVYTQNELPTELQMRMYSSDAEAYGQREAILKEFALRLALAQKKDKNADINNLPPLEELLDAPEISDAEMRAFFDENQDRLPPNTSFEEIKDRLAQFLMGQKGAEVFHTTWAKMENEGHLKLLVRGPSAPAVTIPIERFPQKGSEDAPHTLVEVSDYLCPHCQTMQAQVNEALKQVKGKVRLVLIPYSLRPDRLSGSLAEGAFCAQQQGNDAFWKYHAAAFSGQWGSMNDNPSSDTPKAIADKAGINSEELEACLVSDAAKQYVDDARQVANSLGVTGTPSFFFNNRRLDLGHGPDFATILKKSVEQAQTGT